MANSVFNSRCAILHPAKHPKAANYAVIPEFIKAGSPKGRNLAGVLLNIYQTVGKGKGFFKVDFFTCFDPGQLVCVDHLNGAGIDGDIAMVLFQHSRKVPALAAVSPIVVNGRLLPHDKLILSKVD